MKPTDTENELQSRRLGLVRTVLWATLLLGVPAVIATSVRAVELGEPQRAVFYVVMILSVLAILAWPRAPYHLQVGAQVGILYAVAVHEFLDEGLEGAGPVLLLTTVGVAALLTSRRVGILVLACAVATHALFAWLYTTGVIAVPTTGFAMSTEAGEWITKGLLFFVLAGTLFASQSYLIPTLTVALDRAQKLAAELRGTVSEREELVSLQQAVFEAAADGILAVELEGHVVSYNERLATMWSLSHDVLEAGEAYAVIDNGIGFDMEHAAKLFQPFWSAHGAQESGDYAGIGLATALRIIERHNGSIWAEAEVDVGASIFFTL